MNASKDAFLEKRNVSYQSTEEQEELGFDFFLSFSSKDLTHAKKITSKLRKEGFTVFASNDSLKSSVGQSYFDSIDYALHSSRNFLLLATPNASQSTWVKTEWQAYFNEVHSNNPNQRKIFIYKGKDFDSTQLNFALKNFQHTDRLEDIIKVAKSTFVNSSSSKNTAHTQTSYNSSEKANSPTSQTPQAKPNTQNKKRRKPFIIASIFIILTLSIVFYATKYTTSAPSEKTTPPTSRTTPINTSSPSIQFDETTIDFSTVREGSIVKKTFKFKNTGDATLQINNLEASCSCINVNASTKSIPPGEYGKISVNFNTQNKVGNHNQKITITSNTSPRQHSLYLKGNVIRRNSSPRPISRPTNRSPNEFTQ